MINLQIDDSEVEIFLNACRDSFGENLIAVVLFGSRYWGFAEDSSDYDLFIFVNIKDAVSEKYNNELVKNFPNFHIRYFLAIDDKRIVKRSGWASFVVLTEFSYPLYKTKIYDKFLSSLKQNTPDIIEVTKVYKSEKNKYELDEFRKKDGFKANEWGFFSIWKRLQIIDYYKNNKVKTDLHKNIEACADLLLKKDTQFIKKLQRRTFKRSHTWNRSDYLQGLDILENLNKFIENIPK